MLNKHDTGGMLRKRILLPALQVLHHSVVTALDAVSPRRCAFCGMRRYPDEMLICKGCHADLPRLKNPCPGCARPMLLAAGVNCADCQARPLPFTAVVVPFAYAFPIDAAIRQYKFRRKLWYAPAFAELLLPALDDLPDSIDAILPVPLHWLRHGVRGFNQAAEVSRGLCRQTGLPMLRQVYRRRPTPYQSGSNARARRRNLRRAFSVRGRITARHVLIVDDVVTTGETCRQLARVLTRAGVDEISVLAIARA